MTNPVYTKTVLDNLDWLEEKVAQGAIFFVGHSGGKDSQAQAAVIESLVPASQIVYIHADLGDVEWPGIKDFIRNTLPKGRELNVVEAIYKDGSHKGLIDRIERQHKHLVSQGRDTNPWPDQATRYCTSELKVGPIWKLIRNWPGCTKVRSGPHGIRPVVINCVGIRAQESVRRAKLNPLTINKVQTNSKREAWDFYPLFDLSVEDVWAIIKLSGQTRHPAYDAGNNRLSCQFCVFGSANDWRNAARTNPGLYQRYVGLEKKFGKTIKHGQPIEKWVGLTVAENNRRAS